MKALILMILLLPVYGPTRDARIERKKQVSQKDDSVTKVEMHLSAFGVESDNYPSIDVLLDFVHDTSTCNRWFYDPAKQGGTYSLTKKEMQSILMLLAKDDIKKLKKEYSPDKTDQPSSKMTIYTQHDTFTTNDYGLQGDYPLNEIYKIVYKFR